MRTYGKRHIGGGRGVLRIIGGRWRSRRLAFAAAPGLRPTTDRMRETLFNWLAHELPGAHCADLFAGSGALGLEALSRGAAHCDFVEISGRALAQIRQHLAVLGATADATLYRRNALDYLHSADRALDIVFIDPPFDTPLAPQTCAALATSGLLRPGARIYLEQAAGDDGVTPPPQWREINAGSGIMGRPAVRIHGILNHHPAPVWRAGP